MPKSAAYQRKRRARIKAAYGSSTAPTTREVVVFEYDAQKEKVTGNILTVYSRVPSGWVRETGNNGGTVKPGYIQVHNDTQGGYVTLKTAHKVGLISSQEYYQQLGRQRLNKRDVRRTQKAERKAAQARAAARAAERASRPGVTYTNIRTFPITRDAFGRTQITEKIDNTAFRTIAKAPAGTKITVQYSGFGIGLVENYYRIDTRGSGKKILYSVDANGRKTNRGYVIRSVSDVKKHINPKTAFEITIDDGTKR